MGRRGGGRWRPPTAAEEHPCRLGEAFELARTAPGRQVVELLAQGTDQGEVADLLAAARGPGATGV